MQFVETPIFTTAIRGQRGIPMKKQHFDKLVASVKQAGQIRRGLGKSQSQFALMIGVSLATLRNWEQGRRHPDGPARALLKVAAANPRAVETRVECVTPWSTTTSRVLKK